MVEKLNSDIIVTDSTCTMVRATVMKLLDRIDRETRDIRRRRWVSGAKNRCKH